MKRKQQNTWLEYIETIGRRHFDPESLKLDNLEAFMHLHKSAVFSHAIPMVYLLDYTTGKYIMVSPSVKQVMGYEPDDFLCAGLGFTLDNYQKDDLVLYNKDIFPDRMALLKKIPPHQHPDYVFSYNFRFLTRQKEYINLLQRNCFLKSDDQGNPLISMGIVTNIQHYKSNNPVIQTVEKLASEPGLMPEMIYKKAFFANEEHKLFTKREKEVLEWTADGLTSREIAHKLGVSEHTIINHRRNMQEKTHTRNVVELISFAIRKGII